MRDLKDIVIHIKKNSHICLDQASFTLSPIESTQLEKSFIDGVPLSVLMGFSEFYHHKFFVNHHVLIPRPETEYMVDLLVSEFKGKVNRLLDVGVGSGVILLSLLDQGVGASGVGVDLSLEALNVAKINARRLKLNEKVEWVQCDRFSGVQGIFDLIVSNPPYIKANSHRHLVHSSVDAHEPHMALYLPDEDYEAWFQAFFLGVKQHLHGTFMMEGHEQEIDRQAEMLMNLGFEKIQVIKDLAGVKRFVRSDYYS